MITDINNFGKRCSAYKLEMQKQSIEEIENIRAYHKYLARRS